MKGENPWKVAPPPIHTHYSEETQRAELCGRVVCPFGYVGITFNKTTMQQNTLNSEIEREIMHFRSKFPTKEQIFYKADGTWDFTVGFDDVLRQSLRSIAEKSIEAVRVEEDHTEEYKWKNVYTGNGTYPNKPIEWQEVGFNKAVYKQNKLSSAWLGKEN